MVYQVMHAGQYLEGDVATTLKLLSEALRALGVNQAKMAERRARWAAEHRKWEGRLQAAEEKAASLGTISTPLLAKTLREVMPPDTAYVDETIVHAIAIREHLDWRDPLTFFRARPVVVIIGDGTFMYNPVVPAIAFADEHKDPTAYRCCQQHKIRSYAAFPRQLLSERYRDREPGLLRRPHQRTEVRRSREDGRRLRDGSGEAGGPETGPGGCAQSNEAGKTAILNVMMPAAGKLR
jgi:acetolactate synthase-1/2/3 large subunit